MSIDTMSFMLGGLLVAVALLGGGITAKLLPKVARAAFLSRPVEYRKFGDEFKQRFGAKMKVTYQDPK